jgi:hypothetical protein
MHVLLLLANSHAFRLRTHYFNRLLGIQIYQGGSLIPGGSLSGAGGTITWTVPSVTTPSTTPFAFTAVATDSYGTAGSNTLSVTYHSVFGGDIVAPIVTLQAPPDSTAALVNQPLTLSASATISGGPGSIDHVDFYANASKIGSTNTAGFGGLYTISWTPTAVGSWGLTARAFTAQQKEGDSAPVAVNTFGNGPNTPTISFSGSGNVTTKTISLGQDLQVFLGNVASPGSTITKADIYTNGTLATTLTTPGTTTSSTVASPQVVGIYNIYSIISDANGLTSQSATITATVADAPPTFQAFFLTSSQGDPNAHWFTTHRSSYSMDESLILQTIYVQAHNAGASIQRMDYYVDGTLALSDTSAPIRPRTSDPLNVLELDSTYTFYPALDYYTSRVLSPPLTVGAHSVYGVLYDTRGSSNTTQTISFTVGGNSPPSNPTWGFDAAGTTAKTFNFSQPLTVYLAGVADPDAGDRVATVDIYNCATKVLTTNNPPATVGLTTISNSPAVGSYSLHAVLTDTHGVTTQTPNITAPVAGNQAPVLAVSAVTATTGIATTIAGTATDEQSATVVTKINGTATFTNLTVNGAFSNPWTPAVAGSTTIAVVATDPQGLATTNSQTITVAANQPPTIALTPGNNTTDTPGNVTFAAGATDAEGEAITNVSLYIGSTLAAC